MLGDEDGLQTVVSWMLLSAGKLDRREARACAGVGESGGKVLGLLCPGDNCDGSRLIDNFIKKKHY